MTIATIYDCRVLPVCDSRLEPVSVAIFVEGTDLNMRPPNAQFGSFRDVEINCVVGRHTQHVNHVKTLLQIQSPYECIDLWRSYCCPHSKHTVDM